MSRNSKDIMSWDIGFENIFHEKLHFIGSANKDLFRVGWRSLSFRVGSGDEWHFTLPSLFMPGAINYRRDVWPTAVAVCPNQCDHLQTLHRDWPTARRLLLA